MRTGDLRQIAYDTTLGLQKNGRPGVPFPSFFRMRVLAASRGSKKPVFRSTLFNWALASLSLGVTPQQIGAYLYLLVEFVWALRKRQSPAALVKGFRCGAALFFAVILMSFYATWWVFPDAPAWKFHGAFALFFAVSGVVAAEFNPTRLHRLMMVLSIPGLICSVAWLLQPSELAWALKVGFESYPRASGLVSNPITHAEGLAVIAAWSLARLRSRMDLKERRWIILHLVVSVLVVVVSRVRSGLLGFLVLFILNAAISRENRKFCLGAALSMMLLFMVGLMIFGFNMESIRERGDLARHSLHLIQQYPILGIGPERFDKMSGIDGTPCKHSHNTVLGVTTEAGILGLLAFVVFLFCLFRAWWVLFRERGSHKARIPSWTVDAFASVLASFLVFGLTDFNFSDTECLVLYSLHFGLMVQLAYRSREDSSNQVQWSCSLSREGAHGTRRKTGA